MRAVSIIFGWDEDGLYCCQGVPEEGNYEVHTFVYEPHEIGIGEWIEITYYSEPDAFPNPLYDDLEPEDLWIWDAMIKKATESDDERVHREEN